ncbi:hypothetical protein G6045_39970, partial [Streptomyces sp. YC504]
MKTHRTALAALVLATVFLAGPLLTAAQAGPADEGCGYTGTELDLDELGRIAREQDVEDAVRRAGNPRPAPP